MFEKVTCEEYYIEGDPLIVFSSKVKQQEMIQEACQELIQQKSKKRKVKSEK